jgi:hypothetical protein
MPVEEESERCVEHGPGFGVALGAAVEAGEIIADAGVCGFDKMSFRLGDDMWFGNAMLTECQSIATVGVRTDAGNGRNALLHFAVERYCGGNAFADDIRNNTGLPSRISSPYDGTPLFFWT